MILEVKMEKVDDELKIVVPEPFCKQLGLVGGDTLLVTVEAQRVVMRKKGRLKKARN